MVEYVLGFEQIDRTKLAVAGGKGANLGELSRIGEIRVPGGFCVTTDAFAEAMAGNAEFAALLDRLSHVGAGDTEGVRAAGSRIRAAVEATPIPAGIADEIGRRLTALGEDGRYAIRSSATAEDLPTASFAGQQDTYLNVSGAGPVLDHVRRCWASLFTDRAIVYRLRNDIDHHDVRLAVVVQRMVFPEVAGIAFTADPITSDRKTTSIDAGFGLGEAMVSGRADPDTYTVRDGRILRKNVSAQALAVEAAPGGGIEEKQIEPGRRNVQKLTDEQILRLAAIGRTIEARFGSPQDIEWSLADDTFFIVQSRPITTLFPVPDVPDGKNHVYISIGHHQMMTDAMKPLGSSFFSLNFDAPLVTAGGRLYADISHDLAAPAGRRIILAATRAIDPLMFDAIEQLTKRKDFMNGLARGRERFFSTRGAGYFSWRLPVEAIKLYFRNDPGVVPQSRARDDAALDESRRRIGGVSGDELFAAVIGELGRLKKTMYRPERMAIVYVGMYAQSRLNKWLEKWLGVKGAADVLARSVTGNVTSEMGPALLGLAETVRDHPAVPAALPHLTDAGFFAELSAVDGGDAVGRAIRGFLDGYGMRCAGEIDITRPRWSESPTTLVPLILNQLRDLGPDARAATAEQSRLEAETMGRDLVARLERLPRGRRKAKRTRKMISRLRNFAGYREYPKYLMMRYYWIFKQALLGEAAKLVDRGVIQCADDVGHLTYEEFREAVRTGRLDPDLLARRKAEFASFTRLTPPRMITSEGEVITGAYARGSRPDGALAGIPASAGVIEGRARIVRDLSDATLEEGDILVTAFTDPAWTPVFLSVKGLVTEVGGSMTHGAVVAREYGLPAVVGVEGATRLIRDGRPIRVNGTEGYVELL